MASLGAATGAPPDRGRLPLRGRAGQNSRSVANSPFLARVRAQADSGPRVPLRLQSNDPA